MNNSQSTPFGVTDALSMRKGPSIAISRADSVKDVVKTAKALDLERDEKFQLYEDQDQLIVHGITLLSNRLN